MILLIITFRRITANYLHSVTFCRHGEQNCFRFFTLVVYGGGKQRYCARPSNQVREQKHETKCLPDGVHGPENAFVANNEWLRFKKNDRLFFHTHFKLFRSCKQIKYKLWANDNNITGDRKSSKSWDNDARWLYISLVFRQYVLGTTWNWNIVWFICSCLTFTALACEMKRNRAPYGIQFYLILFTKDFVFSFSFHSWILTFPLTFVSFWLSCLNLSDSAQDSKMINKSI